MSKGDPIYLDYQATTPLDPRVLDRMLPYLSAKFGNPHSATHRFGWEAEAALDVARDQIAEALGGKSAEVYFTSGATEANNWVLKGVIDRWHARPKIVTVVTEHKCVLEAASAAARQAEHRGGQVTFVGVDQDGLVDLEALEAAVDDQTALVSVMLVNNEIGVIQPLDKVAAIAHAHGALVHSDAAQAFGKIPLDVKRLPVDFLSLSGHKIYGPKGVGALWIRSGRERYLTPLMDGGGQEGGLRSGTQAPALVAGFGYAAKIADDERAQEADRLAKLMARFRDRLFSHLPALVLNGHTDQRIPGNLNVSFPGLDGDLLLAELRGLAVSSGAACASAVDGPSYVLEAIGRSEQERKAAIRFGIGRMTEAADLDTALDQVVAAVERLGGLKP